MPKLTRRLLYQICAVLFFIDALLFCYNYIPIDWYFLVPTGKYLLQNGFPDTNPWFVLQEPVLPDQPYVIQQWLYCIYAYFIDKWHLWLLSILLIAGLILFVMTRIGKCHGVAVKDSLIIGMISLWVAKSYMFSLRPEALTILLLLLQCLTLEHLSQMQRGERPIAIGNIVLLYITTFLQSAAEANLHSSMWMIHFCILIAYLMPGWTGWSFKSTIRFDKHVVVMIFLMCIGTICSPIGLQPVTYVFHALHSDTFELVDVAEMEPGDGAIAQLLITVGVMMYGFIKSVYGERMRPVHFWLTAGFCVMTIMATRNMMFLPIAVFIGLVEITGKYKFLDEQQKSNHFVSCILIAFVYVVLMAIADWHYVDNDGQRHEYPLSNTHSAMDEILRQENGDKSVHVYTEIESGAYLEYYGFDNVYMDARPETFNRKGLVDENTSVLEEYSLYFKTRDEDEYDSGQDMEIAKALARYEFAYFIIDTGVSGNLADYLDNHPEQYELASNYNGVRLYKTIGGDEDV